LLPVTGVPHTEGPVQWIRRATPYKDGGVVKPSPCPHPTDLLSVLSATQTLPTGLPEEPGDNPFHNW